MDTVLDAMTIWNNQQSENQCAKKLVNNLHEQKMYLCPKFFTDFDIQSVSGLTIDGLRDYEKSEVIYRFVKTLDRQSMIFYMECIPHFLKYMKMSILTPPSHPSYSMLDIGARSGSGANLFAEMFYDNVWGHEIRIVVDTTDLDTNWNEYCDAQPYIRTRMNQDIFTMDDNSYDFVFCSHTIEHLDDPYSFCKKATSIAKRFALFYCPYNEKNPQEYHRVVDDDVINKIQNIVYKEVILSNGGMPECVLFICDKNM